MSRLILIFLSAFALLTSPALAKDPRVQMWIVSQMSGDARVVRSGLQPAALKARAQLAPGDIVTTGATGRATLARGADYIVMAPRSELRLPSTPQPTGFTRVIQNLGTMLFKVQRTGVPHFAVDTPMLAAVVKGTTFTVVVDKDRSAVQVIEGAVQVSAKDGGMSQLVEGGRTVFIDHSNPKALIDADVRLPATSASSLGAIKITGQTSPSLGTIASLTDGLVRLEAAPQPKLTLTAPTLVSSAPTVAATTPVTGAPAVTTPVPTAPIAGVGTTVPPIITPIVETTAPILTPIVETTAPILTPIVEPIAPILEPIVEPIAPILAPIVEPIAPILAPIVEPIAPIVAPILTPILPCLLGC